MGFLKKKEKTIDFTKFPDSRIQERRDLKVSGDCVDLRGNIENNQSNNLQDSQNSITSAAGSVMDFLGSSQTSTNTISNSSISDYPNSNEIVEVKRMLRASSGKIEDNSNEIYRLIQRIELLERKIERLEGN